MNVELMVITTQLRKLKKNILFQILVFEQKIEISKTFFLNFEEVEIYIHILEKHRFFHIGGTKKM